MVISRPLSAFTAALPLGDHSFTPFSSTAPQIQVSTNLIRIIDIDPSSHFQLLRIPIKFVKKYGKELSFIATLTGPNGRIWVVELEKVDSKLWFHNGWHEFVDYCSIRVGHFLVFKYGRESNFHVHVYDLAVCEISYPCNSSGSLQKPCRDNQCLMAQVKQEAEADGFMEMFCSGDDVNKCLDKYMQSNMSSSGEYEHEGEKLPTGANFGYSTDKEVEFNESELTTTPCKVVLPILGEAGLITRRLSNSYATNTNCMFYKLIVPSIIQDNKLLQNPN